jgi:hypothetical protein
MADTAAYATAAGSQSEFDLERDRRGDAAVARHNSNDVEYLDWSAVYDNHMDALRRLECAAKG